MTYAGCPTFLLADTGRYRVALRRYSRPPGKGWTCADGYHQALAVLGEAPARFYAARAELPEGTEQWSRERDDRLTVPDFDWPGRDDPRWPTACECGYVFGPGDEWQHFSDRLYRRSDTAAATTLRDAPPGAMWDAWWYPASWRGADGRCLVVKCPNGQEWVIDSRASNCTEPE